MTMTIEEQRKAIIEDAKAAGFTVLDKPSGLIIGTQDNEPLAELLIKFAQLQAARNQSNNVPVAYLRRIKMTDYAISLLPMKVQREAAKEKGWSGWEPVPISFYETYQRGIGKSNWLNDEEFIPLYTSPQQSNALEMAANNYDYIISYLEECVADGQLNLQGLIKDIQGYRALINQPESDGK